MFLDENGLRRVVFWINKRINDAVTKGLHSCESCGAPYKGQPNYEYCGRGFFVDFNMYKQENAREQHIA